MEDFGKYGKNITGGKNIFPNEPSLGKEFLDLLLSSINFWQETWPIDSNKRNTKFSELY